RQMENEENGIEGPMAYPYQIHRNVIPHCDSFEDNGYTKEEMKLALEPQKILNDSSFSISATAVRVPTSGGHSESINVEFIRDFTIDEVRAVLDQTLGITLQDNTSTNTYPMPMFAHNKDAVFVGRLRRDHTQKNTLNMWIVSDNLRKGAATNAIQIAEHLVAHQLV
ncbi:MAG: aspartate-semialdehyde dehydrogenase, partial [Patiriisocius sp.]